MPQVAAYQAQPKANFAERKLQIHEVLERADRENIDFICFPEGFLTGYYEQEDEARKNCFDLHDVRLQKWLKEVSHYKATIIIGFNDKAENQIFDSALAIEKGKVLAVQRKHYLYHDYFSQGNDFSVIVSKGITFGIIVCLDSNYFEPARLLALQGASILFCPMCNKVPHNHKYAKKPNYYSHFVARSHENRAWLVAADWVFKDEKLVCPGHSAIYDPDGQEIVRSQDYIEDLLIVDIPEADLLCQKGRRVHGSPILQARLNQNYFEIR